jgi:hypothetical protein
MGELLVGPASVAGKCSAVLTSLSARLRNGYAMRELAARDVTVQRSDEMRAAGNPIDSWPRVSRFLARTSAVIVNVRNHL